MGAKQSQDSTTSELPPVQTTSTREERSVLSLFSPLVPNPHLQEAAYPHDDSTNPRARDLEVPIQPFFADQAPEGNLFAEHHTGPGQQDRPGHHQDRHHHHHSRHHRDRTHSERSGHHGNDRRAHRYLVGDAGSEPVGIEFDFSLASLNQRLRALQLRRENEDSGSGSSSGGGASSRHHNRSHSSRSRSRNQYLPGSSLFFMRPAERKSSCPVCGKDIPSGELETHIVMCVTKPRVEFNENRLQQDAGECTICLEDMLAGDSIARLPCLCIYHIKCLKLWYKRNQTCPEHPEFIPQ